jgi:hypothetical protein
MPSITIYRSANTDGPLSKQSFRLTPEGGGCFMLLFMQILRGVVAYGPALNTSTILM